MHGYNQKKKRKEKEKPPLGHCNITTTCVVFVAGVVKPDFCTLKADLNLGNVHFRSIALLEGHKRG